MPLTSENEDDHEADEERIARAVDEPREHVAADRIGAEDELRPAAVAARRAASARRRDTARWADAARRAGAKMATRTRSVKTTRPTTAPLFMEK